MSTKKNVYGEGNYEAARQYDDAAKRFVQSGRVEEAARAAAPKTPQEAKEMADAEQAALLRGKEKTPPMREPPRGAAGVVGPKREARSPDTVATDEPASASRPKDG
jgi:hypothetical protein